MKKVVCAVEVEVRDEILYPIRNRWEVLLTIAICHNITHMRNISSTYITLLFAKYELSSAV